MTDLFPYNVSIDIVRDSEELYDCLQFETINKNRSNMVIKKKDNKLCITINAKDATSLRATFDGLVKLLITFEKMRFGICHD